MSSAARIDVLLVDDHEITRAGLIAMLEGTPARIVGEAATAEAALQLAVQLSPHVALLDIRLGGGDDGLDLIRPLRKACVGLRVVIFSAFDNPGYLARARAAGAHAFLPKSGSRESLLEALTGLEPQPIGARPQRRKSGRATQRAVLHDAGVHLTPRETQILRLMALGLANKEIAASLSISLETVKEHVQNLLRKLAVHDRTQAAVWALRHGLG